MLIKLKPIKNINMKNYFFISAIILILSSFNFCELNIKRTDCNHLKYPQNHTTLDSLQGIWVSNNDSSYQIKFSNHSRYAYYANQLMDSLNFTLDDSCHTSSIISLIDNGTYIREYDVLTNNFGLCYFINVLSDSSLELFTEGRHLRFNKK